MLATTARNQFRRQLRAAYRPLTTSAILKANRLPGLGDITHNAQNTGTFNKRLNAFRESQKPKPKPQPQIEESNAGIVKTIIFGSEKGQREEAEMEQSYSKVLARGKYVHAIEIHRVHPEKQAEYVKLVGSVYPAIATDKSNNCHLVGSWKTEVGDQDTFGK